MKRYTEQQESTPIIGGSSLLVIFAVLCLTVFALLGLSNAQAEAILAQLRCGEMPEAVTAQGGNRYAYACPISDTQELQVEVQVSGKTYHILRWQTVSTADWGAGNEMTVWDGETAGTDTHPAEHGIAGGHFRAAAAER